jgi:hypothetical protein
MPLDRVRAERFIEAVRLMDPRARR